MDSRGGGSLIKDANCSKNMESNKNSDKSELVLENIDGSIKLSEAIRARARGGWGGEVVILIHY
jgi:hypothetical protein